MTSDQDMDIIAMATDTVDHIVARCELVTETIDGYETCLVAISKGGLRHEAGEAIRMTTVQPVFVPGEHYHVVIRLVSPERQREVALNRAMAGSD